MAYERSYHTEDLDAFKIGGTTAQKCDTMEAYRIGKGGWAVKIRRETTHYPNSDHTDPHDHRINWETPRHGVPNFEKVHTNYWPDEYPNGAPEFKSYGGKTMHISVEDYRFKTIAEFKECIIRGGEPVFVWNGDEYGVCFVDSGYCIARTDGTLEKLCSTPDEVLEYEMRGDRLRDVITQVTVLDRAL